MLNAADRHATTGYTRKPPITSIAILMALSLFGFLPEIGILIGRLLSIEPLLTFFSMLRLPHPGYGSFAEVAGIALALMSVAILGDYLVAIRPLTPHTSTVPSVLPTDWGQVCAAAALGWMIVNLIVGFDLWWSLFRGRWSTFDSYDVTQQFFRIAVVIAFGFLIFARNPKPWLLAFIWLASLLIAFWLGRTLRLSTSFILFVREVYMAVALWALTRPFLSARHRRSGSNPRLVSGNGLYLVAAAMVVGECANCFLSTLIPAGQLGIGSAFLNLSLAPIFALTGYMALWHVVRAFRLADTASAGAPDTSTQARASVDSASAAKSLQNTPLAWGTGIAVALAVGAGALAEMRALPDWANRFLIGM